MGFGERGWVQCEAIETHDCDVLTEGQSLILIGKDEKRICQGSLWNYFDLNQNFNRRWATVELGWNASRFNCTDINITMFKILNAQYEVLRATSLGGYLTPDHLIENHR